MWNIHILADPSFVLQYFKDVHAFSGCFGVKRLGKLIDSNHPLWLPIGELSTDQWPLLVLFKEGQLLQLPLLYLVSELVWVNRFNIWIFVSDLVNNILSAFKINPLIVLSMRITN